MNETWNFYEWKFESREQIEHVLQTNKQRSHYWNVDHLIIGFGSMYGYLTEKSCVFAHHRQSIVRDITVKIFAVL